MNAQSRNSRIQRFSSATALAAVLLLGVGAASAQAPPAGEHPDLEVTVTDLASQGQLIRVVVNKTVLIKFNQPVRDVRLANADIAQVTAMSPKQLLLTGMAFGSTQMVVWFNEQEQKIFDVAVDVELDRLIASIRSAVPRARVEAHSLLDSVVLTGSIPDAESAAKIQQIAELFSPRVINHTRVAGEQQVLLRVTVAEVNRSAVRRLGFNGWIAGDNAPDMFGVSNLAGLNPSNIGAAGDALVSPPAAVPGLGGALPGVVPFLTDSNGIPITASTTVSIGFPRVPMQIFIRALRENGLLKILAEPNLVTVTGQEASFLAGGEFPIPLVTSDRIKIEFKEFGVRLNFTPAVLSSDIIRVHVAPEISEPDFTNSVQTQGYTIPGFTTRRVDTVVEIGPGQTFAVGGLLSERLRGTIERVPGLGDVPVLGALFRSVEYQAQETEFVVLVTPELVRPLTPDQVVHVPGNNLVPPNDWELYGLGKLDGEGSVSDRELNRPDQSWPVRPSKLYGPAAALQLRGPFGPASGEEGS